MKNQSKEDEYIRQFINELGTVNPNPGFHKSILGRLRPKQTIAVYTPVISLLGWKIIGGVIGTIVFAVLLFLPSGNNPHSLYNQIPPVTIPQVTISLPIIAIPDLELSSLVIQALIVFISLGIISVISTLTKWKTS
jgi:hypothetical protein